MSIKHQVKINNTNRSSPIGRKNWRKSTGRYGVFNWFNSWDVLCRWRIFTLLSRIFLMLSQYLWDFNVVLVLCIKIIHYTIKIYFDGKKIIEFWWERSRIIVIHILSKHQFLCDQFPCKDGRNLLFSSRFMVYIIHAVSGFFHWNERPFIWSLSHILSGDDKFERA